MKRLHIEDNIMTFIDDGEPDTKKESLSDVELVRRLIANPDVSDEIRALARLVHLLATQETG